MEVFTSRVRKSPRLADGEFRSVEKLLSKPVTEVGDKTALYSFLRATGATQKRDFQQRWGRMMEVDFGFLETFVDKPAPTLTLEQMQLVARNTKQFR